MRFIAIASVAVSSLFFAAAPAFADTHVGSAPIMLKLGPNHVAKIQEEIRNQEARVRELEPIIARDVQARNDLNTDAAILERHAREQRARANEFRSVAGELGGSGGREELLKLAGELDTYAQHDEENARVQRDLAQRLEGVITSERSAREWHQNVVNRLRAYLQANQ